MSNRAVWSGREKQEPKKRSWNSLCRNRKRIRLTIGPNPADSHHLLLLLSVFDGKTDPSSRRGSFCHSTDVCEFHDRVVWKSSTGNPTDSSVQTKLFNCGGFFDHAIRLDHLIFIDLLRELSLSSYVHLVVAFWGGGVSNQCLNRMYGSSGCVGGCVKPPPVTTAEKYSNKQRHLKKGGRGHLTHPPKDWWTTSSNEMENNSTNPCGTQRSASVGTPNHSQDSRASGTNSTITNATFVNHALMLWNERRSEWVGHRPRHRANQSRDPVISWSTTYEDLLATSRPFPQPVPLPEMVDFLVDVWEQEGLYE